MECKVCNKELTQNKELVDAFYCAYCLKSFDEDGDELRDNIFDTDPGFFKIDNFKGLPIDVDILYKRKAIPIKLAELSYKNSEKAVELLRKWGEKKSPITPLYDEICNCLRESEAGENDLRRNA